MSGEVVALVLAGAWAGLVAGALVGVRPRRRVPLGAGPRFGPARTAGGPLAALGRRLRRTVARLTDRPSRPTDPVVDPGIHRPVSAGDPGVGAGIHRPSRPTDAGIDRPVSAGDPAVGAGIHRPSRPTAGDPGVDAWIGAAAVLALVLLVVAPALVPLPLVGAAVGPRLALRRAAAAHRRAWAEALPDAVDLLALGLGSGLAVAPALALAAPRTPEPLGPALARAHDRVVHGAPLADALEQVAQSGPASRPLVALLVAAHGDGAPVVEPLTRLAGDLRADRRRAVEARARQVPVRLLFPLVLCSLPAFVLLAIVPPVVAAISDLRA